MWAAWTGISTRWSKSSTQGAPRTVEHMLAALVRRTGGETGGPIRGAGKRDNGWSFQAGRSGQSQTQTQIREFIIGVSSMGTVVEAGKIVAVEQASPLPLARAVARSWPVRTALLLLGSTVVGLLFALPMWTMEWKQALAQWWAWGLMAPLIFWADRALPFTGREFGRRAVAHIPGSLLFTSVYVYLFYVLRAAIGDVKWSALQPGQMIKSGPGWLVWSLLVYWMIVGAMQAYRYYERYVSSELRLERMEKSYGQARLNALRMQLDPHFLFNALNTISSHVERDPRLTRSMIEHLGDLLRLSLENKDRQEVPLAEELAFLDHYLEIQKIRFGDQLTVDIDVDAEVRYASVPSLFLQPLVENAIRHGISRRISGGAVTVTARAVDGKLSIQVEDDGMGLPPGWSLESSSGLGLTVTRERIEGLYPAAHAFSVRRRGDGGTRVEIQLPLKIQGEEQDAGN
jgi:two-component system, LytTR family, sensor kinase